MRALLLIIRRTNERFALALGSVLAWSIWPALLLAGSVLGLTFRMTDAVMLILTIQTSLDAAATKMLQNHVRSSDQARDAMMHEQISQIAELLCEVKAQNDAAARRDRLALKRDKLLLATLELQYAAVKERTHGHRPTRRRANGSRKAH